MTQTEMVLQYIKVFGSITPKEAFDELGVYRLSAVIHKLRKQHPISTKIEKRTNNINGKTVRYARYKLEEAENA